MFEMIVNEIVYYFFLIVCASPVTIPLLWLNQWMEEYGVPYTKVVQAVSVVVILLWYFVVAPFLTHHAAKVRVEQGKGFMESLSIAWMELKVYLAFLPVVGHYFERKPKDYEPPPLP